MHALPLCFHRPSGMPKSLSLRRKDSKPLSPVHSPAPRVERPDPHRLACVSVPPSIASSRHWLHSRPECVPYKWGPFRDCLPGLHNQLASSGAWLAFAGNTSAWMLPLRERTRDSMNTTVAEIPIYGCVGGVFGLLVAIGTLYGDMQFLLFFTIGIKARYLVAIYALISIAMLFGEQRMYAFAQLGGALAGLLYGRRAPRRGVSFAFSERWYAFRNGYYRWKRRRAARKFEVYMRRQGRTVRFDGQGRKIDEDADDKKRWN